MALSLLILSKQQACPFPTAHSGTGTTAHLPGSTFYQLIRRGLWWCEGFSRNAALKMREWGPVNGEIPERKAAPRMEGSLSRVCHCRTMGFKVFSGQKETSTSFLDHFSHPFRNVQEESTRSLEMRKEHLYYQWKVTYSFVVCNLCEILIYLISQIWHLWCSHPQPKICKIVAFYQPAFCGITLRYFKTALRDFLSMLSFIGAFLHQSGQGNHLIKILCCSVIKKVVKWSYTMWLLVYIYKDYHDF